MDEAISKQAELGTRRREAPGSWEDTGGGGPGILNSLGSEAPATPVSVSSCQASVPRTGKWGK